MSLAAPSSSPPRFPSSPSASRCRPARQPRRRPTRTAPVDLACSNGQTYPISVVEPSADQWAGHLVAQPGVLIPTAFQFDVTVLAADGTVIDRFSTPVDLVRGRSEAHHDVMTCTFSQTDDRRRSGRQQASPSS